MALPAYALPFGMRDLRITPYLADGVTLGTPVDLPASRTLSFSEAEESEELRGDDTVVAQHGNGPIVNWDLEGGGISLEAWKALTGGTITTTGVTPNVSKKLAKRDDENRPYFKIEGQIISDSGGDLHSVIWKAKCTGDLGGDFQEGSFFLTGASGTGIGDASHRLWDKVHNETAVPIP